MDSQLTKFEGLPLLEYLCKKFTLVADSKTPLVDGTGALTSPHPLHGYAVSSPSIGDSMYVLLSGDSIFRTVCDTSKEALLLILYFCRYTSSSSITDGGSRLNMNRQMRSLDDELVGMCFQSKKRTVDRRFERLCTVYEGV